MVDPSKPESPVAAPLPPPAGRAAVSRRASGPIAVYSRSYPLLGLRPVEMGRLLAADIPAPLFAVGAEPELLVVSMPLGSLDDADDVLIGVGVGAEGGEIVVESPGEAIPSRIGLVAIGAPSGDPLPSDGARVGDVVILTKPIGTGVLLEAWARGDASDSMDAALGSMMTSDRVAASVARQVGAGAVFAVGAAGLLGTAAALGAAAGVRVTIDPAEVPVAQGAWELVGMSGRSAGAAAVIEVLGGLVDDGGHDADFVTMLADPQLAGGLLMSVTADRSGEALSALAAEGFFAEDIGEIVAASGADGADQPGAVLLR